MNAKAITTDATLLAASARAFELIGNMDKRNEQAAKLFAFSRCVSLPNGHIVETWWDRSSRNWITQRKDSEGCELWDEKRGCFIESDYTGNREDAAVAHLWAICKELNF